MIKILNAIYLSGFLAFLVMVTAGSCSKKNSDPPFELRVHNLRNIVLQSGSNASADLEILQKSGVPGAVSLSVTGLPSGVTATFTPQEGIPAFRSVVLFEASAGTVPGVYPLTLIATSGNGRKEYILNLEVQAGNEQLLPGVWTLQSIGTDLNRNGIYDAGEAVNSVNYLEKYIFLADYSGFYITADTVKLTWDLQDNKHFMIRYNLLGAVDRTIASITSAELILGDLYNGTLYWQRFTKE